MAELCFGERLELASTILNSSPIIFLSFNQVFKGNFYVLMQEKEVLFFLSLEREIIVKRIKFLSEVLQCGGDETYCHYKGWASKSSENAKIRFFRHLQAQPRCFEVVIFSLILTNIQNCLKTLSLITKH